VPIIANLDVVLAKRKTRLNTTAERDRIRGQNLSILKTGKAKAIRFRTPRSSARSSVATPPRVPSLGAGSLAPGRSSEPSSQESAGPQNARQVSTAKKGS
jgi:hypothetical protein